MSVFNSPAISGAAAIPWGTARTEPEFRFLTPETLIAYCTEKLRDLDSKSQSIFQAQNQMNRRTEVLGNLSAQVKERNTDGHAANPGEMNRVSEEFTKAMEAVGPGATRDRLEAARDEFNTTKRDGGITDRDDVNAALGKIDAIAQTITNDSQINMVQLQQLVSQRQTALTMTTNLIASLNESAKTIAGNVGR